MDFTHFYDVLRDNINSYRGEYERIVDYAPDLFRLLADVLRSDELGSGERLRISAAMGYLVAPYDVIPEEIYGPHGYIDDVYLCAVVVEEIASKHGYGFLEDYWAGDEDLEYVIEECLERASEILGEKTEEILSYAGLR